MLMFIIWVLYSMNQPVSWNEVISISECTSFQFWFWNNSKKVLQILNKRLFLPTITGVTDIWTDLRFEGKIMLWRCAQDLNLGLAVGQSRLRERTLIKMIKARSYLSFDQYPQATVNYNAVFLMNKQWLLKHDIQPTAMPMVLGAN